MHEPMPPFLTRRQVWILTTLAILNHITFTGARVNVSLTAIHLGASELIVGVFAPAGTPAPLITRLNQEFVRVLTQADMKEKFLGVGVEPRGGTPEQMVAIVKSDMAKWGKVIKEAGIRVD